MNLVFLAYLWVHHSQIINLFLGAFGYKIAVDVVVAIKHERYPISWLDIIKIVTYHFYINRVSMRVQSEHVSYLYNFHSNQIRILPLRAPNLFYYNGDRLRPAYVILTVESRLSCRPNIKKPLHNSFQIKKVYNCASCNGQLWLNW